MIIVILYFYKLFIYISARYKSYVGILAPCKPRSLFSRTTSESQKVVASLAPYLYLFGFLMLFNASITYMRFLLFFVESKDCTQFFVKLA